MRSDLLFTSCIPSALQGPVGKLSSEWVWKRICSALIPQSCFVVPNCKPAQSCPMGVAVSALKLTEHSDLVAKWNYRYERQMAWNSWY